MKTLLNRRQGLALALASILPFGAAAKVMAPSLGPIPLGTETFDSRFGDLWDAFKLKFVKNDGYVTDTGNKGIAHTEGLGVAMFFAQEAGDKAAFDLMTKFSTKLLRPDGLHSWKWEPGKGIVDPNNASDGDVYLAWALLRAGLRWKNDEYLNYARRTVAALEKQCVAISGGKKYLMPGVEGFIEKFNSTPFLVLNPSYWILPAFKEFRAIGTVSVWNELYTNALAMMQEASWSASGLPADWIVLKDPVSPWQERPARFGYEAIRIPLFLVWDGASLGRSIRAVAKIASGPKFPAWTALDLREVANYEAPLGFKSVGSLTSKAVYGLPIPKPTVLDNDYYSSSLILLSSLAAKHRGWA